MKTITVGLGIALLALVACNGGTDPPIQEPSTPTVTALGTPVGNPVTQTIGAAGGTLQTADGSLSITVPAGALSTDTAFTLQARTNPFPGGIGLTYTLEPRDVTVNQPVEIAFTPSADDLEGTGGTYGIAVQDDAGAWSALSGARVTTLGARAQRVGRISVMLRGFSQFLRRAKAFGKYASFRLNPPNAAVRVGQSVTLAIRACDPKPPAVPPVPGEDDLEPISCGIPKRNASALSASTGQLTQVSPGTLRYTAPAQTPSPNPVTLTVTYDGVAGSGRVILLGSVRVIGSITRYFGPVSFNYNDIGGNVAGTGNVTYERIEEQPDYARYALSGGSFTATFTPRFGSVTCTPQTMTLKAGASTSGATGDLQVWKAGSNPGKKYSINVFSEVLEKPFSCIEDGKPKTFIIPVSVDFVSTSELSYTEETQLKVLGHRYPLAPLDGEVRWDLQGE
jgi:hypothetical protein